MKIKGSNFFYTLGIIMLLGFAGLFLYAGHPSVSNERNLGLGGLAYIFLGIVFLIIGFVFILLGFTNRNKNEKQEFEESIDKAGQISTLRKGVILTLLSLGGYFLAVNMSDSSVIPFYIAGLSYIAFPFGLIVVAISIIRLITIFFKKT